LNALLANFLGSLLAGLLLAGILYWLVTRPLEILRPAKERRFERATIVRMVREELSNCLNIDTIHQDPKNEQAMLSRFPTSAWDAACRSASFPLSPTVTAAVFRTYEAIEAFNKLADRIEALEVPAWSSGSPDGRSGAEILRRNLLSQVRMVSGAAAQECRSATEILRAELASIEEPQNASS